MGRSLVIVESPAKAKTINKYLGRDYTVKASIGHVMDLPKKTIGIRLPDEPGAIHWGLVCRTYQPELAAAWAQCRHHFGAEANQDSVFEASVFWVVSGAREWYY